MTSPTPPVTVDHRADDGLTPRVRDADLTRLALLRAARRRFAMDGYSSTTVRDIAADAGVNVALINRYFDSKEGLFEAALERAAEQLERPEGTGLEQVAAGIVRQLTMAPGDEDSLQLLLLLRRSGDERADRIRRDTLRSYAQKIAAVAGWSADRSDGDALLLRAEVVISAALGVALLRSSGGLEPLGSATAEELTAPLRDAITALLEP